MQRGFDVWCCKGAKISVRRTLTIYALLLWAQIRSQFQYRFSFWMDLFSTGLMSGIGFLAVVLVMLRFESIGGWTLGEVAFLAGMIEMSFGLMDMVFGGFDPDWFSGVVQSGRFDQFLLRPVNLATQLLGANFLLRRLGRVLEGIVFFGLSLWLTPVSWSVAKLLYLPVVVLSQVVAMGSLFMVGSGLIFWTVQRIEAVNILTYGGVELMSYPVHIYPRWLQRFFTFGVPFVFLNYYPALYFLDKPDVLGFPVFAPFWAPLAAAGMLLMAIWFWRFALRHYQSTGS